MKPQAQTATPPPKEGQSPFFSVIVPVYNVAPYLGECLDSVLAQTFPDWECLCTDDGSKDGSDLILDAYARRDPRFRVTHQPNAGVSAARNRALDRLRGQWVGFVDPDDFVRVDWLKGVRGWIRDNPSVDLFRFRFARVPEGVDARCRRSEKDEHTGKVWIYDGATRIGVVLRELPLSGVWGGVYARSLLASVRFPIGVRVGEDCLFSIQVSFVSKTFALVDYVHYFYRQRKGSAISKRQYKDALEFLSCCATLLNDNSVKLKQAEAWHDAQWLFTKELEWEYVLWFGYTKETTQYPAHLHWEVMREAWRNDLFRTRMVKKWWQIPMFFFLHGGTWRGFRLFAMFLRIGITVRNRVRQVLVVSWRKALR